MVGPKNLLFLQRIADRKEKQILRGVYPERSRRAQDDSIAFCYTVTLKMV